MGIMAQEGGTRTEREIIPMDLHRAVCVNVVDLGSHLDVKWNKVKQLVRLTFELADIKSEYDVDGEQKMLPRLMGKDYNLSLHEKAVLRQHLQSWRKKQFTPEELAGFDISNLVGAPCMLNVGHYTGGDGKTYAGIDGIIGLGAGMTAPTPEGDTYYYSITDHGREFPEAMPDWLKQKVLASNEMVGQAQQAAPAPQAPAAPPAPQAGYAQDAGASVGEEPPPF